MKILEWPLHRVRYLLCQFYLLWHFQISLLSCEDLCPCHVCYNVVPALFSHLEKPVRQSQNLLQIARNGPTIARLDSASTLRFVGGLFDISSAWELQATRFLLWPSTPVVHG